MWENASSSHFPVEKRRTLQEDLEMTRRELREHCFKMLFCTNFYPAEEAGEQLERYFETPEEDETTPEGYPRFFIRWIWMKRTRPIC